MCKFFIEMLDKILYNKCRLSLKQTQTNQVLQGSEPNQFLTEIFALYQSETVPIPISNQWVYFLKGPLNFKIFVG